MPVPASNAGAVHQLQRSGVDAALPAAFAGPDPASGPLVGVGRDASARRAAQGAVALPVWGVDVHLVRRDIVPGLTLIPDEDRVESYQPDFCSRRAVRLSRRTALFEEKSGRLSELRTVPRCRAVRPAVPRPRQAVHPQRRPHGAADSVTASPCVPLDNPKARKLETIPRAKSMDIHRAPSLRPGKDLQIRRVSLTMFQRRC